LRALVEGRGAEPYDGTCRHVRQQFYPLPRLQSSDEFAVDFQGQRTAARQQL
jgi:hypothetical protein